MVQAVMTTKWKHYEQEKKSFKDRDAGSAELTPHGPRGFDDSVPKTE